jgi:chromosomal replication initiator protein
MNNYDNIWESIKSKLQITLEDDAFNENFGFINSVFKVVNNNIYLVVPNSYIKNKIETFYLNRLNVMLNELVTEKHLFKILTKEQASEELSKTAYNITSPETGLENKYKSGLNNSYTFDNFVVGASNRLAYTSAIKVADPRGEIANPLYIFGDVGLEKPI